MATASIKATAVITLTLTVEEAEFIKDVTQRIWYETATREQVSTNDCRYSIFTELKNVLNSLPCELKQPATT